MIVDRRDGSRPLIPLLRARGASCQEGTLGYGDVQIEGRGPGGCPVLVGVEYKKLPDLAQSIDNGRLVGHQLPGMLESYNDVWLLVEGIWRRGENGLVEVPRGRTWSALLAGRNGFSSLSLDGFLLTLQIKMGIKLVLTGTSSQTVDWLLALNHWWTAKEWEEHRAHLAFDNSNSLSAISRPTLLRRVAKELPGVGWERSSAVARHFGSVVDMATAPRREWEEIDGIGPTIAGRIISALEGTE
jgi:ERCC4-type nuclease